MTDTTMQASRPARLLTKSSTALLGAVVIAFSVLLPGFLGNAYWTYSFTLVTLYVTVAIFQNILLSEAGQMSFGQGAVFGIAAVTAAVVTTLHGQPFWVGALAGTAAGLLLGGLFAAPALRVQGYYLGFVTLSAALVFPQLLIALDGITGGVNGVPVYVMGLSAPLIGSITPLSLLAVGLAVAALAVHAVLPHTPLGRKMIVVSMSPEAAQSLGVNPGFIRFTAFMLAAFGTALAGILYVPLVGFVGPTAFRVDFSILFFFAVIVGGQGKLLGPIIGIWVMYLVPNVLLADFSHFRLMIYGIVALVVMLAFPDGIIGSAQKWWARRAGTDNRTTVSLRDVFDSLPEAGRSAATFDEAPAVVEVKAASKSFGSAVALDNANLVIRAQTLHGLVGPNGSGKTTMLNAISGFLSLDSGEVNVLGRPVRHLPAWRRARLGLARTFQTPRIFERLSLWNNIRIGAEGFPRVGSRGHLSVLTGGDHPWKDQNPALLPHGQRRLLEILRILESDSPLILLDEPAGGLSPEERADLGRLLTYFRDNLGKTILLVEHDLSMVWQIADEITVMETGTVAAAGKPDLLRRDPNVTKLFTGGSNA